jgi:hypothetical protein
MKNIGLLSTASRQRGSGLPREDVQEALFGAFQARLLVTFESDAEPVVDEKLAGRPASLAPEEASRAEEGAGEPGGLAAGDKRAEQQSHGTIRSKGDLKRKP